MSIEPLALPTAREWELHGISDTTELHAGKQSRVFAARIRDVDVAVKLTDGRLADAEVLATRMSVVEALAATHRPVARPHRFEGTLVTELDGWLMTGTEIVRGDPVDASRPDTAEAMGATLARLHAQMAALPTQELPAVAALVGVEPDPAWSATQLLHGDFSNQNVVSTPEALRIFDFDDCGYGPTEYDLANSLYMVLFEAEVDGRADRYRTFRPSFLAGYATVSQRSIEQAVIDDMIKRRIDALGRWLADLSSAPIGIRTSSAEWLDTLRTFVSSQRAT